MARVIVFCGSKGGVGKTTLAVNVGACLGARGRSAVLIDADPQASAVEWAAAGDLPLEVVAAPIEPDAQAWERAADQAKRRDFILIDTPPRISSALSPVLARADVAVIPTKSSMVDLRAIGPLLDLVRAAQGRRRGGLPRVLLVPSMVDRRTLPGRELGPALAELGEMVGAEIGQRTAYSESAGGGQWVGQFDPRGTAATEIDQLTTMIISMSGGQA